MKKKIKRKTKKRTTYRQMRFSSSEVKKILRENLQSLAAMFNQKRHLKH